MIGKFIEPLSEILRVTGSYPVIASDQLYFTTVKLATVFKPFPHITLTSDPSAITLYDVCLAINNGDPHDELLKKLLGIYDEVVNEYMVIHPINEKELFEMIKKVVNFAADIMKKPVIWGSKYFLS